MSPTLLRLWRPLGLVAFSMVVGSPLRGADEPAGDLTPILPQMRSLSTNNNPYLFRNYSNMGNGSMPSLSADGQLLLMSNGNGLMLWKLNERVQGQPRNFDTSNLNVNLWNAASALSPDGKLAAIVPQNYGGDMAVRFFDTAAGRQVREIDNDQPIFGLAFSPDGKILAAATQQHIELWNADDGDEVRVFSSGQNNNQHRLLTFSRDGRMLAALGNEPDTIHIWEVASGKQRSSVHFGAQPIPEAVGPRRNVRIMRGMPNTNNITTVAFSADSRLLAVGKQDSSIHLWDLQANRELPPLAGAHGPILALVFTADGKELVAVDTEGMRLSWRMAALRRNNNVRLAPLDDADFAELWDDLAEPDMFRVYRARRHLTADPKRAVPLLSRHLKPVPPGDTVRIQQLVKDLSSPNAGKRRKAMTELRTKHGEAALGALNGSGGGPNAAGVINGKGGMAFIAGGANNSINVLMQKLQTKYNTPQRQRDVLAVHILEEIGTPEARETLAKLAKGAPGIELTTTAKTALDHPAAAAKPKRHSAAAPSKQLWTELGSDDAAQAFQALCRLTAEPQQAVELLRKEIKPVPVVDDKEIATLLDNLASDDFKVREQATETLSKIAEQALPAMQKALQGNIALEARKRLEGLVKQATGQTSSSALRALRAVEVLEHVGTAESKHVLVALAGGAPQAQLTREAKASLQRLHGNDRSFRSQRSAPSLP